eukprot:CAMPEP_0185723588 /NCGR_PEP_ID=MMETSP1171-20130828/384_1 /TAXON_ID=374046 /ORGANISM="Helicotheca tamensis, Strain CCMP826" /LENGTH=117 /DNA_ID=CAMNT_0028391319 /DNA_START=41 /DNA_END=394 /DNA_ORIENTATION=+
MLSAVRIAGLRTTTVTAPRAALALGARRTMMAIDETLGKKEKVEEDRYIRQKEKEILEKKKLEAAAKQAAAELTAAEEARSAAIAAAKSEVHDVLAETYEKLSDEALENIAKWKLGH